MKLNYETCLSLPENPKCVLVPYRPEHVKNYHEWMKDPYLLEMTGSEPLTFQEEIDMQNSWRDDDSKCTFIILCSSSLPLSLPAEAEAEIGETIKNIGRDEKNIKLNNEKEKKKERDLLFLDEDFIQNNLDKMIGDVNLFISTDDSDDYSDDDDNEDDGEREKDVVPRRRKSAELDIMIAEKQYQRKGIATEAVKMMMSYGVHKLGITRFFVRIKDSNTASLNMFQNKNKSSSGLCFRQCNYAECFKEVELEYLIDDTNTKELQLPEYTEWICKI